MRRTYKFQLRPTAKQTDALVACLESHRELYNAGLQERRDAYRSHGAKISYGMQSAQLKEIRTIRPDVAVWSFSSQQTTLRRLNKAFEAFFRRVKHGETPGYPRFKGAGWFDTVEWPNDGDGCRWLPDQGKVRFQGIGMVKVNMHRAVRGTVKTISVKREGRRWYVLLSCDDVPKRELRPTGAVVAVDLGVTHFLGTSDGRLVPNPRFFATAEKELTAAQQALSRCQRNSNRRRKARDVVAAIHRKIRRQRLDHHHKLALALVRDYDVIVHEDLQIKNMTRSAKGTPQKPGSNVAAKSGLNRSILDAGWGVFLQILASKAESADRTTIAVNPANTSRECNRCGYTALDNRRGEEFRCLSCDHVDHADLNSPKVMLNRAGTAVRQCA
jgi:putative transposase